MAYSYNTHPFYSSSTPSFYSTTTTHTPPFPAYPYYNPPSFSTTTPNTPSTPNLDFNHGYSPTSHNPYASSPPTYSPLPTPTMLPPSQHPNPCTSYSTLPTPNQSPPSPSPSPNPYTYPYPYPYPFYTHESPQQSQPNDLQNSTRKDVETLERLITQMRATNDYYHSLQHSLNASFQEKLESSKLAMRESRADLCQEFGAVLQKKLQENNGEEQEEQNDEEAQSDSELQEDVADDVLDEKSDLDKFLMVENSLEYQPDEETKPENEDEHRDDESFLPLTSVEVMLHGVEIFWGEKPPPPPKPPDPINKDGVFTMLPPPLKSPESCFLKRQTGSFLMVTFSSTQKLIVFSLFPCFVLQPHSKLLPKKTSPPLDPNEIELVKSQQKEERSKAMHDFQYFILLLSFIEATKHLLLSFQPISHYFLIALPQFLIFSRAYGAGNIKTNCQLNNLSSGTLIPHFVFFFGLNIPHFVLHHKLLRTRCMFNNSWLSFLSPQPINFTNRLSLISPSAALTMPVFSHPSPNVLFHMEQSYFIESEESIGESVAIERDSKIFIYWQFHQWDPGTTKHTTCLYSLSFPNKIFFSLLVIFSITHHPKTKLFSTFLSYMSHLNFFNSTTFFSSYSTRMWCKKQEQKKNQLSNPITPCALLSTIKH